MRCLKAQLSGGLGSAWLAVGLNDLKVFSNSMIPYYFLIEYLITFALSMPHKIPIQELLICGQKAVGNLLLLSVVKANCLTRYLCINTWITSNIWKKYCLFSYRQCITSFTITFVLFSHYFFLLEIKTFIIGCRDITDLIGTQILQL